ncbi:MAG: hypothetical protein HY567_00620 [Candidatus Kerfeldbacteria bacterium]|nr:hypothetical protein [Candidatus Kerfeldbacteria bacterium]
MNGTCSVCRATVELEMHERQLVIKPHHDREDNFCAGSHEPPVREMEEIPD